MSGPDRQLLGYAIVAAIVSAGYWTLWIVTESSVALALMLAGHLGAAALTARLVEPRRRPLAVALALVVPVLGPLAAAVSIIIAGRGGDELLRDPHAVASRIDGADIARRLTQSTPLCEALTSSDLEARRQALSKLKRRATAHDITILRWARSQRTGDAAVEVALVFEEIGARFQHEVTTARAATLASPSYESFAAAFRTLSGGIAKGVVDAQLMTRLADEGARHHAAAIALDPIRARELLAARVRLELAMHRPAEALRLLDDVDLAGSTELASLHREAAYGARRFELVPGLSHGRA